MAYELLLAEKEEIRLCFRLSGEAAERCGAIGYLRADFGRSGREFYTTWFDNQAHLKSPDFKDKFDELINSLRDDGQKPLFASRDNHLAFCVTHPSMTCFKIATLDYSFYFRFNPHQGTYDIYCFVYDNRYLLPELAGQHELPPKCFCIKPSGGEMIIVTHGENGYIPFNSNATPNELRRMVNDMNEGMGVTRAQEESMLAGSMLGWNVPAAKPWNYDQNGNPRMPHQPKKNEPER